MPGGIFFWHDKSERLNLVGNVHPHDNFETHLGDTYFGSRAPVLDFIPQTGSVLVRETFDAEETHSIDQQRQGWQAILTRFARYVETRA